MSLSLLRFLSILLALLPTNAAAQILWRNIEAGMTVSRVQELYPEGRDVKYYNGNGGEPNGRARLEFIDKIGRCSLTAEIFFEAGIVEAVSLEAASFSHQYGSCVEQVERQLAENYGPPTSEQEVGTRKEGLRLLKRWRKPDLAIEFYRDAKGGENLPCFGTACLGPPPSPYRQTDNWKLFYSADPDWDD